MDKNIKNEIEYSNSYIDTLKILSNNNIKYKLIILRDTEHSVVYTFTDETDEGENGIYCITQEDYNEIYEIRDFIEEKYDNYDFGLEDKINNDFWEYPEYLYHATDNSFIENILVNGILPKRKTRGLSNYYVSPSIFVTSDPTLLYNNIYGDVIIKIDTHLMKKDNLLLYIQKEPIILEKLQKESLAHSLNVYYESYDEHSDVWESTFIFTDKIPKDYLSVLDKKDYY
jgi:hypothetical protein